MVDEEHATEAITRLHHVCFGEPIDARGASARNNWRTPSSSRDCADVSRGQEDVA
jgi:hypothetical protein